MKRWINGSTNCLTDKVAPELKLDLLQAAQARSTAKDLKLHADLREKLAEVDKMMRAGEEADPLSRYRDVVSGGDAEKGKKSSSTTRQFTVNVVTSSITSAAKSAQTLTASPPRRVRPATICCVPS